MVLNIKTFSEEKDLDSLLIDGRKLLNEIKKQNYTSAQETHELEEPLPNLNPTLSPGLPTGFNLKDYQEEAYRNWILNGSVGLFAMATGTGKTITAINCAIEEYKKTSCYQIIICVPGIPLIHQWKNELYKFNFQNQIDSTETNWKSTLEKKLL